MQFKINANLDYQIFSDSTLILSILANKNNQQIIDENLRVNAEVKFLDPSGSNNRFFSAACLEDTYVKIIYETVVDNKFKLHNCRQIKELEIANASSKVLSFLNPSRYCQSDLMYQVSGEIFGAYENDYDKVAAITDWIYNNVTYLSGSSNEHTTAIDVFHSKVGVCRDFAHLGITFCRALTIPARYFTCYAYQLIPQDFHACFEAYINGEWLLFDATKLCPINGLIKIATGRDAADVPVANLFGNVYLLKSEVFCIVNEKKFKPLYHDFVNKQGISYS